MPDQIENNFEENEKVLSELGELLEAKNTEKIVELANSLHAADIADFIEILGPEKRKFFLDTIKADFDPEIFLELEPELIEQVTESLGTEETAEALSELDSDEVIEVIEELEEKEQQELIEALPEETRAEVEEGMKFPEDSVGRLMHKKYVTVPEYWNVGQVIDYLRNQDDLPEDFHVIYIVDPKHRPLHYVLTSRIMRYTRPTKIVEIARECKHLIDPNTDQEDLAYVFRQYGLVSTPVVNDNGRIIGVVTTEDVVEIIEEESQEDFMKLGGVTSQDFYSAITKTVSRRVPWLAINSINAFFAAFVIMQFEASIEQIVALAVLGPIVSAIVGNASAQTLTVTVNALAKKNITEKNARKYVARESFVGFINGMLLAVLSSAAVYLMYQDVKMAAVFGFSIVSCFIAAGFIGSTIPIMLERLKIDPAIASSAFVIALTDILSFFVFLGLATVFLLS